MFHSRMRSLLLVVVCSAFISTFCAFFFPTTSRADATSVHVWLTTTDGQNKLTPQANLTFGTGSGTGTSTLTVDESQQYQQMTGFGAAMTDTSAYLLGTKMSATQRAVAMQSLFDYANGIGLSFVRIPMGSSDYTATPSDAPAPYSYDDQPNGQTDPTLANFSIAHDQAYIIPTLKEALQINPKLSLMANPWSPPAWMKTNGSMLGTANGQTGTLVSSAYDPLAQYFVKFIQEYQGQNIPIYAITPQNEPLFGPSTYSGMYLSATDEANFIKNNLGPALANANLSTKILAYDHNWDNTDYAKTILGDATTNSYVAGTAWHCYGGDPAAMTTIHNAYPTKEIYETECSTGPTGIAPINAIDLTLRSTQNWAKTTELWNIALDTNGGPKMGTGCEGCTGLITIDQATGNYTFTQNYYQLGQVSKFVLPGAYHIGSSTSNGSLNNAAFQNPDGSKVLVVHNTSSASNTFNVSWNGTQFFTYTLPADAIATFTWSGTQVANTYYNIVDRNSGLVLGVSNRSTDPGAQVVQWTSNGSTDQQWSFLDVGNGYYNIVNRNSGLVLGVTSSSTDPGAQVVQWTSNGNTDQQWSKVDLGGGYYNIVDRNSNLLLGVSSRSTDPGAPIVQWTSNGSTDQQWQLVPVS